MNNYFPHDSNARNSDKLIPLRAKYKAEGYGVYFMLLERLREEPDYTSVRDYDMLAFDLRVDASLIRAIVEDFGLFAFTEDGKRFYSEGFSRRMQSKDERSSKARRSARSRWKESQNDANAQENGCERIENECERIENAQENGCERNANAQEIDASKLKETKGNKTLSLSPPLGEGSEAEEGPPGAAERETFLEIFFFRNIRDPEAEVDRFVNHYQATGWVRKGGQRITDRAAAAVGWDGKADGRFSDTFLKCWRKVYDAVPAESRPVLIRGLHSVTEKSGELVLTCTPDLPDVIEANLDTLKPVLREHYRKLNYDKRQ